MAAEVCTGRNRPNAVHSSPRFMIGKASWAAITTPTRKATTAQNMAAMVNLRTTSML